MKTFYEIYWRALDKWLSTFVSSLKIDKLFNEISLNDIIQYQYTCIETLIDNAIEILRMDGFLSTIDMGKMLLFKSLWLSLLIKERTYSDFKTLEFYSVSQRRNIIYDCYLLFQNKIISFSVLKSLIILF